MSEVSVKIKLTTNSPRDSRILRTTYFGLVESLVGFTGFWGGDSDYAFFIIKTDEIYSLEVVEESDES